MAICHVCNEIKHNKIFDIKWKPYANIGQFLSGTANSKSLEPDNLFHTTLNFIKPPPLIQL
jgi:hypothetical protein